MKAIDALIAFIWTLRIAAVVISIYGLVLAFQASVVLGLLSLFVAPSGIVFGVGKLFWDVNLPQIILAYFQAHS
jgi:hypothetical protein